MSRRIETGTPKLGSGGPQEEFVGRLVKYVPTEIIGLYVAAVGVVPPTEPDRVTWLWWIFFGSWLLTPIYLRFATMDPQKGPLWLQVSLASVAFPIWVFAIGGPFASLPWYRGFIASILLSFVTVIFGLIKPKPGS